MKLKNLNICEILKKCFGKHLLAAARKPHNILRAFTVTAYVTIFLAWYFLKLDVLFLVLAIAVVFIIRIFLALWLVHIQKPFKFKKSSK